MEGCRVRETYELTAAVFHVRDAKTAGNIVTVVKVRYDCSAALRRAHRYQRVCQA